MRGLGQRLGHRLGTPFWIGELAAQGWIDTRQHERIGKQFRLFGIKIIRLIQIQRRDVPRP